MGGNCSNPPPEWPIRPQKVPDSQAYIGLNKCLARQLKTYGIEHPPVKLEKFTPMGIVQFIVAAGDSMSNTKT